MDRPWREKALQAWAVIASTGMIAAFAWMWYKFFDSIPPVQYSGPRCVCPQDDGKAPSRQPTEDDYYNGNRLNK